MKKILISIILILGLLSCKSKKGTSKTIKLENSSWEVISLGSETLKSSQTLIVKDGSINGKGACNGFGGKIKLENKNLITLTDVVSTKMGCSNLSEEKLYFQALNNTSNYKLEKEELSFFNAENILLVKFKKI